MAELGIDPWREERRAAAMERVVEMRVAGKTNREIAEALG
jgi:DNA-binding CsgD family transcriptional regulator